MDTVISVEHLRKTYGPVVAVDDVSFDVRRGEIFGILGSNGAGKTTTVEILQGLRGLTGGRVEVLGLDPGRETEQLRRRIGSQLQSAALPDRLRVVEAIRLFGRLHEKPVNVDGTIEAWKLERLGNRPFGVLFRRRAAAAVRRPCPPRRPRVGVARRADHPALTRARGARPGIWSARCVIAARRWYWSRTSWTRPKCCVTGWLS